MNYELAKELKDAGFPQNHDYFDNDIVERCIKCDAESDAPNEACHPTLSELIEACGTRDLFLLAPTAEPLEFLEETEFGSIVEKAHKPSETWRVGHLTSKKDGTDIVEGHTPEEAVARLWLALNKHD